MVFETMEIDIIAREHANMDSFPLRYGFYYSENTTLEIYDISERENQRDNRQKLKARFLDPYGNEHEGTFIVVPSLRSTNFKLVTVWRNDQDDEFYLSELMKRLRKAGRINVNDLLDLHERYDSGELSTMDALFSALLEKKSALSEFDYSSAQSEIRDEYIKQIETLKAEKNRVITIAQNAFEELKEQDSIISKQTKKIQKTEAELSKKINEYNLLQSEFEDYKLENAQASSRQEIATLSGEVQLAKVNRAVLHRGSSCTELVFTNGTRKYMKTSTFDRDLSVTKKAERLIGATVKTTCWDPVHEPGKWSSQNYFRGIYEVNE